MLISTNWFDAELTDLLYLREVMPGFASGGPPALSFRFLGRADARSEAALAALAAEWPTLWTDALQWFATSLIDRKAMLAELRDPQLDPAERKAVRERREALWRGKWRETVDPAIFSGANYKEWQHALRAFEEADNDARQHGEQDVLRLCLPALVPAWRRGLTDLVLIPCVGRYHEAIGDHTLVTTLDTQNDVDELTAALEFFASRPAP